MYPQLSEEGFSAPQVGEWLDLSGLPLGSTALKRDLEAPGQLQRS